MPNDHVNISDRFKESIELAQQRITAIDKEAQRVVQDLVARGKASRRQIVHSRKQLVKRWQKLAPTDLLEKNYVKELSDLAAQASEDLGSRFGEWRHRFIEAAGLATRDQVDELARDLEKLSRKIDRMVAMRNKPARDRV